MPSGKLYKAIGWSWVVGGLLASMVAALLLVRNAYHTQEPIFAWYGVLQLAFGLGGCISGVGFLQKKPWAKKSLMLICWMFLAMFVSVLLLGAYNIVNNFSPFWEALSSLTDFAVVKCLLISAYFGAALVSCILVITPFALTLRYLRHVMHATHKSDPPART